MDSKRTLWTFGDSNTEGHGCIPKFEYYEKYYKEGDKTWPEHLSEWLGIDFINKGIGGSSNDMILDSIVNSFDNIQSNDIVIIGKTYSSRFDIPNRDKLIPIFGGWKEFEEKKDNSQFTIEQMEVIVNFQYHFMDSPLFDERWDKRFNWVKGLLEAKGCKCIVWDVLLELKQMEKIFVATKGKIDDGHMSFDGHKSFAKLICNKWFKEKSLI
jgi:lysophospholipase L1-like esterase